MPEKASPDPEEERTKELLERWKRIAKRDEPEPDEASEGPRRPDERKRPAGEDDLDAFLDGLKKAGKGSDQKPKSDIDRLLEELTQEAIDEEEGRREPQRVSKPAAAAPAEDEDEEEDHEIESELELPALAAALAPPAAPQAPPKPADKEPSPELDEEVEPEAKLAFDELLGPEEGQAPPPPAEEEEARPVLPPLVPPPAIERVPPPGKEVVEGPYAANGRTNGGRVNGGRTNGGRVNGGRTNGGRVNGGRVNGGRVNGGRVNGGRVNGGRVNGGYTNGPPILPTRATSRRRMLVTAVAVTALAVALLPMLGNFAPPPPVRIDGAFDDWASYATVSDSATDQVSNPNINLVGVAARADQRALYFYFQFEQHAQLFEAPGNRTGADSYRLLVDEDRDATTGYTAFGLGVDFMVSLTGYNGTLQTRDLLYFPREAAERADASAFRSLASLEAAWSGASVEGAVALSSLSLAAGDQPLLLAMAQDAFGNIDVADAVVTTLPGVLKVTQDAEMAPTLPTSGESLLFSISAQAEGADTGLLAVNLTVESPDGGGVQLTRVVVGGSSESVPVSGGAGSTLRVPINQTSSQSFFAGSPAKTIEFYGRGTGPNGSTVRLHLPGPLALETRALTDGASGLGSVLAPLRYASAYIGEAPITVKIDGAFADWNQTLSADSDPAGDVASGIGPPTGGAPNIGAFRNPGLDIVASRSEISPPTRQVSFMLEAAGSIMSPALLPRPSIPVPSVPSSGTGSPPSPPSGPARDIAVIYVDTDADPATGWQRFSNLGVDAMVEIQGAGGGYGRVPRQTGTFVSLWNPAQQTFTRASASLPVGFNASALETQVALSALCPAGCLTLRYAFYLSDGAGHGDLTTVRDSSARSLGEVLLFDEWRTSIRNVFQGDLHQPLLSFTITSSSTNDESAVVKGFYAQFTGASDAALASAAVFADSKSPGVLDLEELASAPLAESNMTGSGKVELLLASPLTLAPGDRFTGLLAVGVQPNAPLPTWFNLSISSPHGLLTDPPMAVLYSGQAEPPPVRILAATTGSRSQSNFILNELSTDDWFEVYETTGANTSFVSPVQYYAHILEFDGSGYKSLKYNVTLSGSTNNSGFATFTITIDKSSSGNRYVLGLCPSGCVPGNNSTYRDIVEIPQNEGMWGRYPDGLNGTWQVTTANTSGLPNQIPEFQDFALPALGATLIAIVGRRRRPISS